MRSAILAASAALMASACASGPKPQANVATAAAARPDYRHLTCAQLAIEVARTQRAHAAAQRLMRSGQAVASYHMPIAFSRAPTAQASQLSKRLEDLQRASRSKRCSSVTLRGATA